MALPPFCFRFFPLLLFFFFDGVAALGAIPPGAVGAAALTVAVRMTALSVPCIAAAASTVVDLGATSGS